MALTLRLPLELGPTGSLSTLTQDTSDELAQSVRTLVSTVIGERAALPDYGIVEQLGAVAIDEADIAEAIADWEPRVEEPTVTEIATALADGRGLATITIALGASFTGVQERRLQAPTRPSAGITARVDPDDPGVLILTYADSFAHPDGSSILIPIEGS